MRIVFAVLILLFILLCLPICVRFSVADGECALSVRYLFFSRRLLPGEASDSTEKPPKKSGQKKKPGSGEKKKSLGDTIKEKPPGELLRLALDTVKKCIAPVRRFFRRTTLARFNLRIVVAGKDAADTALRYGRYQSIVPLSIAAVDRTVRLRAEHIDIVPGFCAEKESFAISGEARVCPLALLAVLINLGITALCAINALNKIPAKQKNKTTPPPNGKEAVTNGK